MIGSNGTETYWFGDESSPLRMGVPKMRLRGRRLSVWVVCLLVGVLVLLLVGALVAAASTDARSPEQKNRDAFRALQDPYAPYTDARSPEQKNRDAFRALRDP